VTPEATDVAASLEPSQDVSFKNASFEWPQEDGNLSRQFVLDVGNLCFRKGQINLVTGHTGSGKTSLLLALLGNFLSEYLLLRRPLMSYDR
jgi:energy-coupling factor transporter ATP-binding protein EcfA2